MSRKISAKKSSVIQLEDPMPHPDCRDDFDENLLGRDVINEFEMTVWAKRDVVRFEWVSDEII
ncbi:MAG: hypothetical protein ONB44_19160 [candidate division KSB1 bacterium]|nr:hypothetical protein [candidate division KSB1 bacterium]MDZ7304249.1 hypothetical protein [candidate division KSB1 bacterium]